MVIGKFKFQEMSNEAAEKERLLQEFVPDHFKTKEM